ncbi:hypothetical protein ACQKNB_15205 [Lysinibacillus xylanilyticus]
MRKRSANVAAATWFRLCESVAAATTTTTTTTTRCRSVSRYRMDAMILG